MLLSSLLGKSLAVKVALGVAGMSAAGVGVAAETGSLPAPAQQAAYQVAGALGVPAARSTGGTVRAAADASPTPEPSASPEPSESPEPTESPEPSESPEHDGPDATGPAAKGLCQAYESGHKAGKSDDSTALRALVTAAGGADKVEAYCAQFLSSKKPASATHEHESDATPHASTGHGKGGSGKPSSKPTTSHGGDATKTAGSGHGSGHEDGSAAR